MVMAYLWWANSVPGVVEAVPNTAGPPRGYDSLRDVRASAEATKLMEKTLLEAAKDTDQILLFVEISIADGHLVVHFKDLYSQLDPGDRAGYEEGIAVAWRSTGYVKDREWSPNVEFVEHAEGVTRSHLDRPPATRQRP